MKKLITVILILAILLPAAALAGEPDVVGCWATYDRLTTGAPQITALYLSETHKCYYLAQYYHVDEPGTGRAYIGSWEMQSDGSVLAKIGENTSIVLQFDPTYVIAINPKTNSLFLNLNLIYKDW